MAKSEGLTAGRRGPAAVLAAAVTVWALLGGVILLCVVAVNVVSVVGGIVWRPFPGDFELTQMGIAIAVFAFLPYCELTGANVTADIFTAGAGPRLLAAFRGIGALVAFLFSLLLLWRMSAGAADQREYGYATAILDLPVWLAFPPILVSLALLAATAALTVWESLRGVAGRA